MSEISEDLYKMLIQNSSDPSLGANDINNTSIIMIENILQKSFINSAAFAEHINNMSKHNLIDYEKSQRILALFNLTKPTQPIEVQFEYIDAMALKVFFYGLYILIFFLGIAGNALVCYVVLRNSTMHTVTNMFITNLALSDIFLCVFAVPFTPLYLLTYKEWVFGSLLCHLVPYAQGVSVYISAFTLMSIAIDRYFVIIYPFKARMEMRICSVIIITIWLSAGLLTLPYGIFMDVDVYGLTIFCEEKWPFDESRKAFGISTSVLQFVIPFVIITFCYVRVCGKLWDRARARPGSVSMRREELERERTRKTNGMLISMVVIFVISWLPLNIHNLVQDFYVPASFWKYSRAFFVLAHAVAMSSTCYNPFLYAWLNENFRKEFKQVLPCFRASCSTVAAMEMRHRVIRQQCNGTEMGDTKNTNVVNTLSVTNEHNTSAEPMMANKIDNKEDDIVEENVKEETKLETKI